MLFANATTLAFPPLTATCGSYDGSAFKVTINAPGPGRIHVSALVWYRLDHTLNTKEDVRMNIATDQTSCPSESFIGSSYGTYALTIPASAPTDSSMDLTATMEHVHTVAAAGSVTFYVNGVMPAGASTGDQFWYGTMAATYYPN